MFTGDWMGRGARAWGERIALVDVERGAAGRFSYRDLDRRASALAGWLREQGTGPGDRVGVLALNGVEVLDAAFACGKLGAIFVPFNWRQAAAELGPLMALTSPRVLLHGAEQAGLVDELRARGALPPLVVAFATLEPIVTVPSPPPVVRDQVDAEETFCLIFTGGTTGVAKAARISYRMIAWNTLDLLAHEAHAGDVTITHTPLFHTGGLLVYTLPLLSAGGRVVLMRRWDAGTALELLDREEVTIFFAVPTQHQQLALHPRFRAARLAKLRFVTSGGAPLPISVLRAWQAAHPAVPAKQGFGMTEAGPGLFSMRPDEAVAKGGTIGRPNMYVDARLVDEDGRVVPRGRTGELCLRGPVLFSGYFGNEEATRAAFDAEGWFHTGDLMREDEDGCFQVVDRKKDMFISGGENVYPAEIETALYEHPAVALCGVIGVPDERWGEVGRAFVVPVAGHAPSPAELEDHLRARLARFKVPKRIDIVDELPLSPAGKILRRELRERVK